MKASSCHIEIQFSNTDSEPSNPKVSESEDPGAVSHHNRVDLVTLPVVDHAGHLASVVLAEVHAAGSSVQVGEVGAGPAHGGGVDDGGHLVEIVHQQSVTQLSLWLLRCRPTCRRESHSCPAGTAAPSTS